MSKLPWSERVPALSVNPHAADASDVALLAAELMTANAEVARLTRERDEARLTANRYYESMHQFNDQLTAERARAEKLEGQVAALREALCATWPGIAEEEGFTPPGGNITTTHRLAKAALADTTAAAAAHDLRVAQKARREALEEAACLSADYDDHQGMRIAAGIRALASAGNPNEAASGQTGSGKASPRAASAPTPKPQTGSSLAMQEAHNLFTLILGATYDVGMGDRTKEEALSECTKLAHDGMRVTSLPSQEAPE